MNPTRRAVRARNILLALLAASAMLTALCAPWLRGQPFGPLAFTVSGLLAMCAAGTVYGALTLKGRAAR